MFFGPVYTPSKPWQSEQSNPWKSNFGWRSLKTQCRELVVFIFLRSTQKVKGPNKTSKTCYDTLTHQFFITQLSFLLGGFPTIKQFERSQICWIIWFWICSVVCENTVFSYSLYNYTFSSPDHRSCIAGHGRPSCYKDFKSHARHPILDSIHYVGDSGILIYSII